MKNAIVAVMPLIIWATGFGCMKASADVSVPPIVVPDEKELHKALSEPSPKPERLVPPTDWSPTQQELIEWGFATPTPTENPVAATTKAKPPVQRRPAFVPPSPTEAPTEPAPAPEATPPTPEAPPSATEPPKSDAEPPTLEPPKLEAPRVPNAPGVQVGPGGI